MALNLPKDQACRFREITEDIFGVPRGLIAKDPEAAAIIAIYGNQSPTPSSQSARDDYRLCFVDVHELHEPS